MIQGKIPGTYSHAIVVTGARTWDEEQSMRLAFNDVWRVWDGPSAVLRPLLVSGHCPRGADALAERLWRAAGFDVLEVPADWDTYGRRAGFERNQAMVDLALLLSARGSEVFCTAFLDLCGKPRCPRRGDEQLLPSVPGHFSHGTVHCRARALEAGIETIDVFPTALRQPVISGGQWGSAGLTSD